MLTVRDLLADLDVTVLAGESSLDSPVRWVHLSELTDPTTWLSGGEVLLTTGFQLGTPDAQREFVHLLADNQLAGLGFGVGFSHEEVPEALLEAARERDFPVFEVPYALPFIAVTEAAFSRLVNHQYALLRRALAAQERLERIVLSERGLAALVAALASLLGARVLVYDSRGRQIVQHGFRRALEAEELATLGAEVAKRVRRRETHPFRPAVGDPARVLALPVAADAGSHDGPPPEAWLVALKDDDTLTDFDRLVLRQAVTIVALELLRGRVAADTERRLAGDVLAGLLSGDLEGAELQRRLAPFGLGDTVAVLVSNGELEEALRAEGERGLIASAGELNCALVAGRPEAELFALGQRVAAQTGQTLGAGRAVEVAQTRRAFHEARCALETVTLGLGFGTNGNGHANGNGNGNGNGSGHAPALATYKQLGSFQLLLSLQDDEALTLFCDSILGPIESSEGHYGGELMRSLEAFIEENGQWERAAKRLYCHRHTLRYRIKRVEELTGRDLGSARDRIEFWLALRGRELVS